MKSRREMTNSPANISSSKRQKTERFNSLLDTAAKEKIRSYLDAYYLKDNNPGEWLFLEIAFFELYSLRAPPSYQDLKALVANRIYKKAEINLENFLLKLFFDKLMDPWLIVYLLQDNNNGPIITLSEAEMAIVIESLLEKEVSFIVFLVKIVDCLLKKNSRCCFLFFFENLL